jgi:beta-lactamase class A
MGGAVHAESGAGGTDCDDHPLPLLLMVPIRLSRGRRPALRALAIPAVAATLLLSACSASPTKVTTTAFVAAQSAQTDLGINVANLIHTAVPAALTTYIDAKGGHAAVSVVDQLTGLTVAINPDRTFQTASIVKFDILATRLYQTQKAGTTLSSHQKSLAHAMITQSDNNAASALYSADGGASGVRSANSAFGLKETQPSSSWGRTKTTAADQIRLLTAVFDPNGRLNATNRNYMLSLMSQVEKDQAWGITAAATTAGAKAYVKNGWVEMDAYGHLEGDNSIGRVTEPGHDWLIATMSNYNRSDSAGEKILGNLSLIAVSGLRLETSEPAA